MAGWTVESFCDEGTGVCYHGNVNELCFGIPDGERYAGMQNEDDGRENFCRLAKGVPVKTSQCPAMGEVVSSSVESSALRLSRPWIALLLFLGSSAVAAFTEFI